VQCRRCIGPRILEGGHGELHDGIGVPGAVEERVRQRHAVQVAIHPVGDAGNACEDPAGERREHLVARAVEPLRRRQPESVRGRVAAGERQREHAADHQGRAVGPRVPEHEGATREGRVSEHGVGPLGRVRRHHRVVLWPRRDDEDVLDVESQGLHPLQAGAIGEPLVQVLAVVEVGVGGERHVRRAGGGDRVCEAGTGDKAHSVAARDEVPGDGEERADVAVDRHAGDDDRGHG
jgi:hypothetical protein